MIDEIRRAIYEEIRWTAGRVMVTGDEMRAALRIEIGHASLPFLLREVDGVHNPVWDQLRGRTVAFGPPTFEGVPLFEVGKLPDPGWRVVNVARKLLR